MIVLVYGLPGTGKTIFAQHFARETGAAHLNTNFVRGRLDARGHYDDTTKQQVYNELYKQIMIELVDKRDIVVDGTFHKQIRREQVKKLAVEMDEPIYLIEIKADVKTVKKWLKRSRKHSEADFEVYIKLQQEFEVEEDHHLELWSGEDSVDEMVNKVKEFMNE